jgi:hypothetical protein
MKTILVLAGALAFAGCITPNVMVTKDPGARCHDPNDRHTSLRWVDGRLTTVITCREAPRRRGDAAAGLPGGRAVLGVGRNRAPIE